MVRYSLEGDASSTDEYDTDGGGSIESKGSKSKVNVSGVTTRATRSSSKSNEELMESNSNFEVVDLVTPMPPMPPKKRRGRPPKAKNLAKSTVSSDKEGLALVKDAAKKRGRGRPPKAQSSTASSNMEDKDVAKKRRGRPPKAQSASTKPTDSDTASSAAASDRPPKAASTNATEDVGEKRGPHKAAASKASFESSKASANETSNSNSPSKKAASSSDQQDAPKRGRDRPPKKKKSAYTSANSLLTEDTDDTTLVPKKKKRGRPPKNVWAKAGGVAAESDPETPNKRGRPKIVPNKSVTEVTVTQEITKKRPPKAATSARAAPTDASRDSGKLDVAKGGSEKSASYKEQDVQSKASFTEGEDSFDETIDSNKSDCDPSAVPVIPSAKTKSVPAARDNVGDNEAAKSVGAELNASTVDDKASEGVNTPTTTLMRFMKTPSISNRRKKSLLVKALAEYEDSESKEDEEDVTKLDSNEQVNAGKGALAVPSITNKTIDDMKATPKEVQLCVASDVSGEEPKVSRQPNENLLEAESADTEKDEMAFEEKLDDADTTEMVALSSPNVTDRTPARRRASSVRGMCKKTWAQSDDEEEDKDSDIEDEDEKDDDDVATGEAEGSSDGKDAAQANELSGDDASASEANSDNDEEFNHKSEKDDEEDDGRSCDADGEEEDGEDDASDATRVNADVAEKTPCVGTGVGGDDNTASAVGSKLGGTGYVSEADSTAALAEYTGEANSTAATNEPRLLYDSVVSDLCRVSEEQREDHSKVVHDCCEEPIGKTPAEIYEKAAATPLLMRCLMGGQLDEDNNGALHKEAKKTTTVDRIQPNQFISSVAEPASSTRFTVPEDSDTDTEDVSNRTDLLAKKLSATSITAKTQCNGASGATPAPFTRFSIEDFDEDTGEEERQIELSKTSVNLIGIFATPPIPKEPPAAKAVAARPTAEHSGRDVGTHAETLMASNMTRVVRQKPPLPPLAGKVSAVMKSLRARSIEETNDAEEVNARVEQTPVASNASRGRAANRNQPIPFNVNGQSLAKPYIYTPSTLALFGEESESEYEDEESCYDKGSEGAINERHVQDAVEGEAPAMSTKKHDSLFIGDQFSFTPLDAGQPTTTNFATPGLLAQFCEALNSQSKDETDGGSGGPTKMDEKRPSVPSKKSTVLSPELISLSKGLSGINMNTPPPEGGVTKLSGENMRSLPVNNKMPKTPQVLPTNENDEIADEGTADFDTILIEKTQMLLDLSFLKSGVDNVKYTGSTTSSQQLHRKRVKLILDNPRRTEDLVAMCLRNDKDIDAEELMRHFDYFSV